MPGKVYNSKLILTNIHLYLKAIWYPKNKDWKVTEHFLKQSIQRLHEISVGSSIHINLPIILEVCKKGGAEHDSWSGLLGGRGPCTHREALGESGMAITRGFPQQRRQNSNTHIPARKLQTLPESQECILLTSW